MVAKRPEWSPRGQHGRQEAKTVAKKAKTVAKRPKWSPKGPKWQQNVKFSDTTAWVWACLWSCACTWPWPRPRRVAAGPSQYTGVPLLHTSASKQERFKGTQAWDNLNFFLPKLKPLMALVNFRKKFRLFSFEICWAHAEQIYRRLRIRGTYFIAGWAYEETFSSLAEHARKCLKVYYLGRIE